MADIMDSDLKPGDILMCKSQGHAVQKVISFGESIATGRSYRNYVHAAIVAEAGEGNSPPKIIEAIGSGLVEADRTDPATVFRFRLSNPSDLPQDAVAVARELLNAHLSNKSFGDYAKTRAFRAPFTTRWSGPFSRRRVEALARGDYSSGWFKGGMFCSMFVVLCYQVAIRRDGGELKNIGLDVDAESMQPSFMTKYLKDHDSYWEELGDIAVAGAAVAAAVP